MIKLDWILRLTLVVIALNLSILAFRSTRLGDAVVHAADARFDHVTIVSPAFLYKGEAGLLLLDRRNGNIWYMSNKQGVFGEPVYLTRIPFEKLDQNPQP